MSINPPVLGMLEGLASPLEAFRVTWPASTVHGRSEVFLAYRPGMKVDMKRPSEAKYAALGQVWLTTERVIFLATPAVQHLSGVLFKGLDIPLALISGEKFSQPLIGANNLSGIVQSDTALDLTTTAEIGWASWSLYFRSGGFGTFLQVFYRALERSRESSITATVPLDTVDADTNWSAAYWATVVQAVAIDPTDGTAIRTS